MARHARAGIGITALALIPVSLSACTGDRSDRPAAEVSAAPSPSASPSPSLLAIAEPDTGHVLTHLENRTGPWQATLGTAKDTGSLAIDVSCIGGGQLVFTTEIEGSSRGSGTISCDGQDIQGAQAEDEPRGRATVTITPDGAQRWSVLVVRG